MQKLRTLEKLGKKGSQSNYYYRNEMSEKDLGVKVWYEYIK